MKKHHPGLNKLIAILNDGHYHDGTAIGEKLNITRSAVWKMIKKLEQYGIDIDSVKGKGYALREPLVLLDKKTIKKNIAHKNLEIDIFESLTSTNDYLKSCTANKMPRVCLAEQQTLMFWHSRAKYPSQIHRSMRWL